MAKKAEERKRKAEEAAKAAAEWVKSATPTPNKGSGKKKGERSPGEAFKRVDPEVWNSHILEGLEDNSCENV
jgi:hypothetical protein